MADRSRLYQTIPIKLCSTKLLYKQSHRQSIREAGQLGCYDGAARAPRDFLSWSLDEDHGTLDTAGEKGHQGQAQDPQTRPGTETHREE
ncbi:hypothetical protein AAFF_G00046030 [Aldrovandia affinis]|uniref:Uncharacterized protein n=1 Tax=Aldrovandia affinis TaxID=143900 RepID=A0AAD7WET5_9TELE|nr:hypothetical protein AAFF_G00046030 [Aldrovandia affinis]